MRWKLTLLALGLNANSLLSLHDNAQHRAVRDGGEILRSINQQIYRRRPQTFMSRVDTQTHS